MGPLGALWRDGGPVVIEPAVHQREELEELEKLYAEEGITSDKEVVA